MSTGQDALADALVKAGWTDTAAHDLAGGILPARYQDDAGNVDETKLAELVALFGGTKRRSQVAEQLHRRFGPQSDGDDHGVRTVKGGAAGKAEAERRFGKRDQ